MFFPVHIMKKVPLKFKYEMSESLHLILRHMHQFAINATGVENKAVHEVLCDLINSFCLHCLCPQPQVVWTGEEMLVVWADEGMLVVWTGEGMPVVWTGEGMQGVWTGEEMKVDVGIT